MDNSIMTKIARAAILEKLEGRSLLDRDEILKSFPEFGQKGAVFVTLNKKGELRGCIGSIVAHRPLIDDLIENARAAAFGDPRFVPLRPDEFEEIEVEISVLTHPEELVYRDVDDLRHKIKAGVDGVILKSGVRQATYLPSVWEQLPDFDIFFSSLCQKAGLPANCLDSHPLIFTYQARKIKEK